MAVSIEKLESGVKVETISDKYVADKTWGKEIWIVNGPISFKHDSILKSDYCGKLLVFEKVGYSCSMHYHLNKHETFYVLSGVFKLETITTSDAERKSFVISKGSVVTIPQNNPHKLTCVEPGTIVEFSTEHFDSDSYRVEKGVTP